MSLITDIIGKKKELTPFELHWKKVNKALEGASNDIAEEIAHRILAQVVAKKIHCWGIPSDEVSKKLMQDHIEHYDQYVKEYSLELAIGKMAFERFNVK